MRKDQLTIRSQEALQRAADLGAEMGAAQIDPEHLLIALIEQPNSVVISILNKIGVDTQGLVQTIASHLETLPRNGSVRRHPVSTD